MATRKATGDLLASVPLFQGLTRKELREILACSKMIEFRPGRDIVTEGRQGIGFHLILEGRAKVTVGGWQRATLGAGDYFGEMSLLDGSPRSATVTAETPLRTLALPSWDFQAIVKKNPSIAVKLLSEMTRRLRAASMSPSD